MELMGKKINFLGDSITQGIGASGEERIFLNLLKEECNLLCARNYGISGTRFARQHGFENGVDRNFCSRIKEMDPDADAIVVFGGTNDFGHGNAPIGEFSDRTSDTFYGACHVLMEGLINNFPESEIVFMTPLHRENEDCLKGDNKPCDVAVLGTYVNIIKEVAMYYSIPVLDLFAMAKIQPKVAVLKEKYCPDGLHPNDLGHIIIAKRLKAFLQNL